MKYSITTSFNDYMKVEHTDDIVKALNAATIYLMDPDCHAVTIFEIQTQTKILDYER